MSLLVTVLELESVHFNLTVPEVLEQLVKSSVAGPLVLSLVVSEAGKHGEPLTASKLQVIAAYLLQILFFEK